MFRNQKSEIRIEKKHEGYIDFLKGIAILAVLVDHLNGILYSNFKIGYGSFYSVTLFVFLGGITSFISMSKIDSNEYSYEYLKRRLKSICIPYAIATIFYTVYLNKIFDFKIYIKTLLEFTGAGPFYFILFFIQLTIISPILFSVIKYINTRKNQNLYQSLLVFFMFIISDIFIKYTFVLPVHGGGKYILGGTYLPVYYLGLLFANRHSKKSVQVVADKANKKQYCILALSLILLIIYFPILYSLADPMSKISRYDSIFSIVDNLLRLINPPGIIIIVYSGMIFTFMYSFYKLISEYKFLKFILKPFEILGKYSMNIFLYHLFFIWICTTIFSKFSERLQSIFLIKLGMYGIFAIALPIIFKLIFKKIKKLLKGKLKIN